EITRADDTHMRVLGDGLVDATRLPCRKSGQLMDDDLRLRALHRFRQRRRVRDIDDGRLTAEGAECLRAALCPCRSDDAEASFNKERNQPPADGAGSASENIVSLIVYFRPLFSVACPSELGVRAGISLRRYKPAPGRQASRWMEVPGPVLG